MSEDPAFYERALRRIDRFAWVAGIAAVVAMAARFGWRGAIGAAAGSAFALFSLRGWKRVARALSGESDNRPGAGLAVRYLLLGGSLFVIIRYLDVSAWAVLAGLLASVAAVIAEIIYELIAS